LRQKCGFLAKNVIFPKIPFFIQKPRDYQSPTLRQNLCDFTRD
jgi:hypothetical protein